MKARAHRLADRDGVIEEVPDPECGPGEVVCRVLACATCGSDVQSLLRQPQAARRARPRAGRRGGGGRRGGHGVPVGDRVAIHHHSPCGECRRCRRGHETLCERFRATRLDPGGFAEYVRVQAELVDELLPLDGMDPVLATFTEPLACALRAPAPGRPRAGRRAARGRRGRERAAEHRRRARERRRGGVGARAAAGAARARRALGPTAHGNEPVDVAIVCTPRDDGDRRRGRRARSRRRAVRLRAAAARQPAGDRRQRGLHARARRDRELVGRPGGHARALGLLARGRSARSS